MRLRNVCSHVGPFLCASLLLSAVGWFVPHGPALADEYIYLAGGRHLADTGRLDARYYDYDEILRRGHPHQDAHSPGYVLLLGVLIAAFRGSYWTAVAANAILFGLCAWLVRGLARDLGLDSTRANLCGGACLLLPALAPYVFWVMSEVTVTSLFTAAVFCGVRYGRGSGGAAAAGLLFGCAALVRETALFGLPAVAVLLWKRGRLLSFLGGLLPVVLFYVPLNANRAGGMAIWRLPWGEDAFFGAVRAIASGDLARAAAIVIKRAGWNIAELFSARTQPAESATLLLFLIIVTAAAIGWWTRLSEDRVFGVALATGGAAIALLLTSCYVLVRWEAVRFVLTFLPALLPGAVAAVTGVRGSLQRRWVAAGLVAAAVFSNALVFQLFREFKMPRQRRQARIVDYVGRYVGEGRAARIAITDGWLFGLRRYPIEVISRVPSHGGHLRALETAIWFDYLVLPSGTPLQREVEERARYRRMNTDDPAAQLCVYRRLK